MAANWEDRLLVVIIDPAPRLSLKDSRYFVRSHLMNGRRGKTRLFSQFMRGAGPEIISFARAGNRRAD
jgi:hypothetical protein